jgi:hypothetical protein
MNPYYQSDNHYHTSMNILPSTTINNNTYSTANTSYPIDTNHYNNTGRLNTLYDQFDRNTNKISKTH